MGCLNLFMTWEYSMQHGVQEIVLTWNVSEHLVTQKDPIHSSLCITSPIAHPPHAVLANQSSKPISDAFLQGSMHRRPLNPAVQRQGHHMCMKIKLLAAHFGIPRQCTTYAFPATRTSNVL
eukprot:1161357-Pelagomonas_calceolata.AAC.2